MAVAEFAEYLLKKSQDAELELGEFMNQEYLRLHTYVTWPSTAQAMPTRLAKSGLFYTGRQDEVRCFSCKGFIKDWRWVTPPDVAHRTLYPTCHFVLGRTTNNIPYMTRTSPEALTPQIPETDPLAAILATVRQLSMASAGNALVRNSQRLVPEGTDHLTEQVAVVRGNTGVPVGLHRDEEESVTSLAGRETNYSALTRNTTPSPSNVANGLDRIRVRPSSTRTSARNGGRRLGNFSEEIRLRSYLNRWPQENPMTPEELAAAGFFYTGISDRVQCAFCFGVLRNWEYNDDAMEEHRKYFPNCSFVNGEETDNVPMEHAVEPRRRREQILGPGITINNNSESTDDMGIITQKPKHAELALESKRLHTFQRWPNQMAQTPAELASAGFYYTGYADNVKCFFCDGGLRNWEPDDDVWESHARWFPKCGYMRNVKGDAYIKQVAQDKEKSQEEQGQSGGIRNVTDADIKTRLAAPVARAVLDMGYSEDLVSKTLRRKLLITGEDYSSAGQLLEAIFLIEEQINNGTYEEPSAMQEHTGHVEGAGSTDDVKTTEKPDTKSKEQTSKESTKSDEVADAKVKGTNQSKGQAGGSKGQAGESKGQAGEVNLMEEIASLKAENEKQKEMRMCKICFDAETTIVFLPCGHLVTCSHCAPAIRNCPICRTPIKGTVRTFAS